MQRWMAFAFALAASVVIGEVPARSSAGDVPAPVTALGQTLAAVRTFARGPGDALWPGYGDAPFGFLIVASDREYLLCQPRQPAGFADAGTDAATGCAIGFRPRTPLPDSLLAAMPLFGPPATIVMGTPETTGLARGAWIRSILHEHFHQLQFSQPGYYARVGALDLAGNDPASWQINYPFPYASATAGAAYSKASRALGAALDARGTPQFEAAFDAYLAARAAFAASVPARDWRYFDFQLWQEGVARWTEVRLGLEYPQADVREAARDLAQRTLQQLRAPDLAALKRTAVYPLGAGEAMLMDACGSNWRHGYFAATALTPVLTAARAACTH